MDYLIAMNDGSYGADAKRRNSMTRDFPFIARFLEIVWQLTP